ncbi:MAG: winged helix-turn-helix domain-containing protein [Cyanobacteria bacterium P01_C01_bin.120]
MRILLIGQDEKLITSLQEVFELYRAEVNCCSPADSVSTIARDKPDMALLDTETCLALPPFFSQLERLYTCPITAGYYPILIGLIPRQIDVKHSRIYLDLGFDLVFQKPVDCDFFFSQVNALDRRIGIGKDTLISPHLLINTATQDCHLKNTNGTLLGHFRVSPVQFSILKLLIQSPRGIWSRTTLMRRIARENSTEISDRAIDKAMYKIRKIIADCLTTLSEQQCQWQIAAGYKHPFIHTQDGGGYYFFDALQLPSELALSWGSPPINERPYEGGWEMSAMYSTKKCG